MTRSNLIRKLLDDKLDKEAILRELQKCFPEATENNLKAHIYGVTKRYTQAQTHVVEKRTSLRSKNTEELRAYVKLNREKNRIYIPVICTVCKKDYKIFTDKKSVVLYTPERVANWICLLCR